LSAACAEKPSDSALAERKADLLLARRFNAPVTIQSVSSAEGGAVVCGYALISRSATYRPLVPFVIRRDRLALLDDDVVVFEAAQRHCGPDRVGPRLQDGVPD
jgi:hypothetical protein